MKEAIIHLIDNDPMFVQHALLFMLERQTETEQKCRSTITRNSKGFTWGDAKFGTSLAQWVKNGNNLSPRQLEFARKILRRYANTQLPQMFVEN